MKKLAVLTACYHFNEEPIYRLRKSCDIFEIPFYFYGLKEQFVNWRQAKIERLTSILPELVGKFEYVLFTDGFDTFFVRDPKDLIEDFLSYNSPLLVSAEKSCAPIAALADEYPEASTRFRFVNGGGFVGRVEDVSRIVGRMNRKYMGYHRPEFQNGNDQIDWTYGFLEKEFGIALDTQCKIFLSMGETTLDEVEWDKHGLLLKETGTYPYVVHFNGPKGGDTPNQKNMDIIYDNLLKRYERKR